MWILKFFLNSHDPLLFKKPVVLSFLTTKFLRVSDTLTFLMFNLLIGKIRVIYILCYFYNNKYSVVRKNQFNSFQTKQKSNTNETTVKMILNVVLQECDSFLTFA